MKNYLDKLRRTLKLIVLKPGFILLLILVLGASLRLYGLNWDQDQHLHPDERFLTMVATAIKTPFSFSEYLNPQTSKMNPANVGFGFFVYGTFPLYLTKIIGEIIGHTAYANIHFVGRFLSALLDIGVILLVFKIGKKVFNYQISLLASFLYSAMVLPIQLSHFFAVDTFANFFVVLSFYLLTLLITQEPKLITVLLLGISMGLALASKVSVLYFFPLVGAGFIYLLYKQRRKGGKFFSVIILGMVLSATVLLTFRINQPIAFADGNLFHWTINPQLLASLKELRYWSSPDSWIPPNIQWQKTLPLIFPLKNMILWGLGLPLGIIAIIAWAWTIYNLGKLSLKLKQARDQRDLWFVNLLLVLWTSGFFVYQGVQFVKNMRYFIFLYPFLAVISASFLYQLSSRIRRKFPKTFSIFYILFFILISIYPLAFMSIYTQPITRVSASEWIYENVPHGSTIVNEEWDDGLPLNLPGHFAGSYKAVSIFLYDFDTPQKWQKINSFLKTADYLFITSNRAYGTTMKLPEKYPQTIEYYQNLFNNQGNFKKVAEFTSYPCFPPGKNHLFCLNDNSAEESFTVYDHPKVMIFQKVK